MDPAPPPSSAVLLPELIDLFVSNVAARKYDMPLDWSQRGDLAACGLVSKAFYLPSRKYLFATVTFRIKYEQYRGQHFRFSNDLDGILSSNHVLQEQIHHLVIKYVEESSEPPYRDPYKNASLDAYLDSSHREAYRELQRARKLAMVDDSGDEKLRRMLPLLPALRKLSLVSHSYHVPCNEAVLSILEDLALSCPHLHRLRFVQMRHIPDRFIQRWPQVDDLELDRTNLGTRAGDLISGTFFKLSGLSLKGAFAPHDNWTLLLSDSMFRGLKNLDITEEMKSVDLFPRIVHFLMPKKDKLNIRNISISINGSVDWMLDLLQILEGQEETWSQVDAAWTSPQYASLASVAIHISLHFLRPYTTLIRDRGTLKLIENCVSHLLPLVSSSRSIDLDFCVKIHFTNLHFAWDNHSGTSDNGV